MDLGQFAPYLAVAEIILAIVIIVLVLLQAKGTDIGGLMGGGDTGGSFRTRRGIEATLHRATVGFSIAFFVCTFLSFIAFGQAF